MPDIDTLTDEFDALAARFATDDLTTGQLARLRRLANTIAAETGDLSGNDVIDAVLVETLVTDAETSPWFAYPKAVRR